MANYTEHYQLHQWEPETAFSAPTSTRTSPKLTEPLPRAATRSKVLYRKRKLFDSGAGLRPAAVLVSLGYQSYNQPRLSIDGDTAYMVMTDSGFRVQDDRNANMNAEGRAYLYLAFH